MTGLKQQFEMSEKTKRKKRKNFSKCCTVKIAENNSEFQSSFSKMSKIVLMISILLQGSGKKNYDSPFYSFTPNLKPLTFKSWINLWRSYVPAKCQTLHWFCVLFLSKSQIFFEIFCTAKNKVWKLGLNVARRCRNLF